MGRIRTIKPEFPQSESIGRLSRDARLCFVMLWTIVDDAGRSRASSRMLASLLYPYDDDARDLMDRWLAELVRERCIDIYEVEGNSYLQVCKWLTHQKIDHVGKSKLPAFDESSRILARPAETLAPDLGPRTIGSRTEDLGPLSETSSPHPDTSGKVAPKEAIYEAYPLKVAPRVAMKAIENAHKRLVKGEHPDAPMQPREAWVRLLRSAQAYARSPAGSRSDKSKIPHPATWFNGSRYNDDPAMWKVASNDFTPRLVVPPPKQIIYANVPQEAPHA